ncbi:DUF1641 domain-containing protein [Brevibacillus ruminantium]|uniref:DUF1641 domain-containing protein n=1 Tax=Brevibacillus ruminantium TaxID=2950604 RepID=A0ABY4WH05_9BACL|nr:DUF1641 domain-containing protein [Brevibacillus ruminantium]USG66144.1 DUF1641 domain-containing protein [Brevibacillus ruminantium]
MARPITNIVVPPVTEKERQNQAVEGVIQVLVQNADGIQETIKLLQELHHSGILGALGAAVEAREDIAKVVVGQMERPPVTQLINNAMAAAGGLAELNPDMTKKLMSGLAKGLQKAEEGSCSEATVGIFDLIKALRDPDINRAIVFGINLLKGVGEGLKGS